MPKQMTDPWIPTDWCPDPYFEAGLLGDMVAVHHNWQLEGRKLDKRDQSHIDYAVQRMAELRETTGDEAMIDQRYQDAYDKVIDFSIQPRRTLFDWLLRLLCRQKPQDAV